MPYLKKIANEDDLEKTLLKLEEDDWEIKFCYPIRFDNETGQTLNMIIAYHKFPTQ